MFEDLLSLRSELTMMVRLFIGRLIVGLLVAGCGAPGGDPRSVSQWLDLPEGPSVQRTVALINSNSGSMGVTIDLTGLPDGTISFKQQGKNNDYVYTNVTFSNVLVAA